MNYVVMLKANRNGTELEENIVVITMDNCWEIPKRYNYFLVFNQTFCYEKFRKGGIGEIANVSDNLVIIEIILYRYVFNH